MKKKCHFCGDFIESTPYEYVHYPNIDKYFLICCDCFNEHKDRDVWD